MHLSNSLKIKLKTQDANIISYENGSITLEKAGVLDVIIEEYEQRSQENGIDKQALLAEYKDVVWLFYTVEQVLQFQPYDYVQSLGEGLVEKRFKFPAFLEGGGAVYIEAFRKGHKPANSPAVGLLVQALGIPKILGIKWEQYEETGSLVPITPTTKVPFGSKVFLHIYTQGLYKQELTIKLMDDDGPFLTDDELPPFERKLDSDSLVIPPMPLDEELKVFKRIVNTYDEEVTAIPSYAQTGEILLTKVVVNQGEQEIIEEKKVQVQKVRMEIFIDPFWRAPQFAGEDEIEIYAKIKHKKALDYISFKAHGFLTDIFTTTSNLFYTGNKAVLVGEEEVNFQRFNPCRFDKITSRKKDQQKGITIFNSMDYTTIGRNPIPLDIITGKKETYVISLEEFDTLSCENTIQKHTPKNRIELLTLPPAYCYDVNGGGSLAPAKKEAPIRFTGTNKTTLFSYTWSPTSFITNARKTEEGRIILGESTVELDVFFGYEIPNLAEPSFSVSKFERAMQYFWLPDLSHKLQEIQLKVSSCAFERNIKITLYPDIKWTLKFGFNVQKTDLEALNTRGLKAPVQIFESLDKSTQELKEKANQKEVDHLNKNNQLKKIKNKTLDTARRKYSLKKKNKKVEDLTVVEEGELGGLLQLFDQFSLSLAEEHYGGEEKNEFGTDFIHSLIERLDTMLFVFEILSTIEGEHDVKPFEGKDIVSIEQLRLKLNRKPLTYKLLYPKIALVASWFYEAIDPIIHPALAGQQGLAIDLNLQAKPLVGIALQWDLLELLCRKHPIAYAILKSIDALMSILLDDTSAVELNFTVTGRIETEIDWQHNMLAGFKNIQAKGKTALTVELQLKIRIAKTLKVLRFGVLLDLNIIGSGKIGLGMIDSFGCDAYGVYTQKTLEFEGIHLEFSATLEVKVKKDKITKKQKKTVPEIEYKVSIHFGAYTHTTPKHYLNLL
ncbi:hypothetical protein HX004_06175 [Myroides sp. 1354]|uniref:hypothetical protein n=1 Tax=unclassified Myroides TaxID=2642485 RepID=UPI0025775DB0|nr:MULTISPECIES: hypothetical protein [unclassified Myroides]MDM1044647.1 hypothetical protein [Myroides sp. R163-1]MDM1055360.1 hypothetical protein [Myroides sp. 1354]MDM1068657.1 hypothetical protein [Myroides sp. 1372]